MALQKRVEQSGAEAPRGLKPAPHGCRMQVVALVMMAAALPAQAQYYYSDTFSWWNSGAWSKNGSPQFGASGLTNNDVYDDSLIAWNNGGNAARQEIRVTFAPYAAFGSGWNAATIYLNANVMGTTGYLLALRSYAAGTLTVDAYDLANGWASIGSAGFSYNPAVPTVVRAIKTPSGIRIILGSQAGWIPTSSNWTGSQGVGFLGGGNGPITQAELAAGDVTAPGAPGAVAAWANGKDVDLQWTAATDNSGGSGVFQYRIYRNGVFIGTSRGLTYTDAAVTANASYSYTVTAEDAHGNEGAGVAKAVTNAPNNISQIGVRPLGSYWGGGGESIDMRSGNVNYTMGMIRAQGRAGLGIGLALSYNSQVWRYSDGQSWNLGTDVGYGYGWKLMAGSIFPVYANGSVSYYIFTDATGADYRLDVSSSWHYWSREGNYHLHFDPATNRLHFNDGSFWQMDAVASAGEPDAGTRYPTRAVDRNGNEIWLEYKAGAGTSSANTSARLDWIWDVRAGSYPNVSYTFTYGTACGDPTPRLQQISTPLPTGENYYLSYTCPTQTSPFAPYVSQGTKVALSTRTVLSSAPGASLTHTFDYAANGSLELSRVTFPYGGFLGWDYQAVSAPNGQQVRSAYLRYLRMAGSGNQFYTYSLVRDLTAGWSYVDDADGKSRKRWEFETNAASMVYGLVKRQQQIARPALTVMRQTDLTWNWTGFNNPYISAQQTQIDPGQAYAKTMKSEQTLDLFGRLTQSKVYDFGNLTTPKWTYNHTYITTQYGTYNNSPRWIENLHTGTTVQLNGGTPVQYFQASYDQQPLGNVPANLPLWRSNEYGYIGGTTMPYRGNRTSSGVPGGVNVGTTYDVTGMPTSSSDGMTGVSVLGYDTNRVAPTLIQTNGLAWTNTSAAYNQIYEVTSAFGPNGAGTSTTYDTVARPTTSTSATGATVTYTYSQTAPQVTTTVNGKWTKAYLDGLGREVKVETGNGGTTVSTVESVYEPCGCSPMGKLKKTTRPYAPGGTVYWTEFVYDAAGRTIQVIQPGGTGTTTTTYTGNVTRVTSAASKWKEQTVDAAGNLVKVTEPNPAGGTWDTVYTYNDRNLLEQVTMARPTGTQTRTYSYDVNGKVLTATNPENGTVTYTYQNYTGLLQQKLDAKGNKVTYVYDDLKRVKEVHRWVGATEQLDQLVKYYYETNPFDGTYTQNANGRLAAVQFWAKRKASGWVGAGSTPLLEFREMYTYSPAGLMLGKRLWAASGASTADTLEASYTFDNEGKMLTQKYPDAQPVGGGADVAGETFAYGFDAMGRPNSMTSNAGATNWISGITYNAAGQPTVITAGNSSVAGETREYNLLGQLTRIVAGSYDFRYNFSATANDGRVTSQSSYLSGTLQETVSYGYDSLNRLTSASGSGWSATYGYDGFTNLLTVTPSGAGPSAMNVAVSSATNRVTGWTYDANGNVTAKPAFSGSYDVENRLAWGSGPGGEEVYGYGADNRRVYQSKLVNAGSGAVQELVTWWQGGKRAGRYELVWGGGGSTLAFRTMETNVWFGGKPLRLGAETNVVADRLGSVRRGSGKDYFPYGQENPATTAGEREKYATYMHDGRTDLAYADQRYYATGAGRFMTADPAGDGLNWYAYTGGDPVNASDPRGLSSLMMYDASLADGSAFGALAFGSSSYMFGVNGGLINVGGGVGPESLQPRPQEIAHSVGVATQFAVNMLNAGLPASTVANAAPLANWGAIQQVELRPHVSTSICFSGTVENGCLQGGGTTPAIEPLVANLATGAAVGGVLGRAWGAVAGTVGKIWGGLTGRTAGPVLNIGGEGEVAGALNFNTPWLLSPTFRTSATDETLAQVQARGAQFVIGNNGQLPFQNGAFSTVLTNNTTIGQGLNSFSGIPRVQPSEVWRVLQPGGQWLNNGTPVPLGSFPIVPPLP